MLDQLETLAPRHALPYPRLTQLARVTEQDGMARAACEAVRRMFSTARGRAYVLCPPPD